MKAAQINDYGDAQALQVTDQAAKPEPGPEQILIEVHAAGVNPFDWKVREGMTRQMAELELPATLGGDVAGTVAALGSGVTGFEVGQAVFGQANALGGQGSFAEFTPVKAASLAAKPESLSFNEAAALPLVTVSAYQALVDTLHLQSDQKILIHGGAGGIGSTAIQLAKHIGAYVATTAAAADTDFVKSLGADEVIDYTAQDFSDVLHDYDAVFDVVGGDTFQKSFAVLKSGGAIVSMVGPADDNLAAQHHVSSTVQFTQVTTERLTKIAELIAEGSLKPLLDKVFTLDEAAEALEYVKTGHPKGKVVIHVQDD